jgi:hypothetical protein
VKFSKASLAATRAGLAAGLAAVAIIGGASASQAAQTSLVPAASSGPAVFTVNQGVFALTNRATGQCLDDSWDFGLRAFPCNYASFDDGYQKWVLIDLTV